ERVADRPAVVAPRPRVDDHAVRVAVRAVDPLDEVALVVRLPAACGHVERVRPLVDAPLELVQAEAAVERGVAARQLVEVDAVEDQDVYECSPSKATRALAAAKLRRAVSS